MESSAAAEQAINSLLILLEREGVIDAQFEQLRQLEDESNPDFVVEVVQLYFEDSGSKIDRMAQLLSLQATDFEELDQLGKWGDAVPWSSTVYGCKGAYTHHCVQPWGTLIGHTFGASCRTRKLLLYISSRYP